MKVYDYQCDSCMAKEEIWVESEADIVTCSSCGSNELRRIITTVNFLERRKPYSYLDSKGTSASRITKAVPQNYKGGPKRGKGD